MKIWVTGARGLLGKAVLQACAKLNVEAVGTARENGDVTDIEMLMAQASVLRPTHIVNCAAYTDVDRAEQESAHAFAINAQGAENMAIAARAVHAHFTHISTDFIFAGSELEYEEDTLSAPINVYGKSKLEGEKRILQLLPEACIMRTSWLYGNGGANFLSKLVDLIRAQETLSVVADQWGRITYAPDLADAILSLLNQTGVFHFANTGNTSRFEVAECAHKEMQARSMSMMCKTIYPLTCKNFSAPAPRPTHSFLKTEKFERITGRRPRHWIDGLREFIRYA